jgi:hypothetical protein
LKKTIDVKKLFLLMGMTPKEINKLYDAIKEKNKEELK